MPEDPKPPSVAETNIVDVEPIAVRRNGIFTIASGLDTGKVLRLPAGEMVVLGRAPECTYSFDDASLSRQHARVMRVGAEYVIRDDGSRNGTFVNNVRLTKAEALRNGDRVQLGSSTLLRFALVDEEEERALRRVYEAAILDGLTGIYNRKHLEERLVTELAYAARHGAPLSIVMIDVDHFKKVNDTYGHLGGDAVLRAVAALFGSSMRVEDVLARYGGEEFVILLRGTPVAQAIELAERLRRAVEATAIPFEGHLIRITSSAGVASLAEMGMPADRAALLGAADARLYQAKQSGRNRVVGP
ncbi:MAG: GGDEF domain-containing protein [Myxococcales bacterium]|nr:GGDEF domain-containing protein [Myxococcales bacterium]